MSDGLQVLSGSGEFQKDDFDAFITDRSIANCKTSYQIVSIVGPQSSGKSTLLNHVFGTKFVMMDAMTGRSQTTKGVWLSKSPKVTDITTLVMDLEGNDGRERGEDDTNYERQIALFALSVSDTLIINIWCHDIGREHGAGKPIIKTIMQVNLKLFAPEPNRKRTVILFVIRDKSRTPQAKLEEVLLADMERIWQSISKPLQYQDHSLSEFFEVKFAALSHYEEKYEDFVADANILRRRFAEEDLMVSAVNGRLPAEALPMSFQQIWEVIRSQKDLNLPAHKVMVANVRCNQIKDDQLSALQRDQAWQQLQSRVLEELVPGFGASAASLMDSCIQGYEMEAMYFDTSVRGSVRDELETKLHALVKPAFDAQLTLLQKTKLQAVEQELKTAADHQPDSFAETVRSLTSKTLEVFKQEYMQDLHVPSAPWNENEALESLSSSVAQLVANITNQKAAQVLEKVEKHYIRQLAASVSALLDSMPTGVWSKMQAVAEQSQDDASAELAGELTGFELSKSKQQELEAHIRSLCQQRVETLCREAASTRLSRMKDRFHDAFSLDKDKTPRTWSVKEDIPSVARRARLEAARLLAQLCVLRLDNHTNKVGEEVERAVLTLSNEGEDNASSSVPRTLTTSPSGRQLDMQSAATWPDVGEDNALLQPTDVRTTWREFMSASNNVVQQALLTQQANKAAARKAPPLWAIALILILGMNEILAVLYSPLYLLVAVVLLLLGRTMYVDMDVDGEMQKGALPGMISLASKFRPAFARVTSSTFEASATLLHSLLNPDEQQTHTSGSSIEMTNTTTSAFSSTTPTPRNSVVSSASNTPRGSVLAHEEKKQQ